LFLPKFLAKIASMEFGTGDAKNRLTELLRAAERGEQIVITRHGRPVAQITPPPAKRRKARLGGMKDRIRFRPGWDAPVDPDRFLEGGM
jgi:prevent-host-death family protein